MIADYLYNVFMSLLNPVTFLLVIFMLVVPWFMPSSKARGKVLLSLVGMFFVCVVFAFVNPANTPKNVTFNDSAENQKTRQIIEVEYESTPRGVQDLTKPIEQATKYETPDFLKKD